MSWRSKAGTTFTTSKKPGRGSRGMVVSNHPLASAAGAEMLAAGGNAVDAAIATLFTLTIVEPMMVGILGGGTAHIRQPDGTLLVIDGMATCPGASRPDMYRPISDTLPDYLETENRENTVGALALASPTSLRAWAMTLKRFGTMSLADVMEPAIRHAARGFRVTHYLAGSIAEAVPDLARDPEIAKVLMPGGNPLRYGEKLVQGAAADTLRAIAAEGPDLLHDGALGARVAEAVQKAGGILTVEDLRGATPIDRQPIHCAFGGFDIAAPPPPAASGVHITQMLNFIARFDIKAMGFGTPESCHLLAEAMKLAFADRKAASGDPAFVEVPVAKFTDPAYAAERAAEFDPARARDWGPGITPAQSAYTTHMTAADSEGRVVATTQTINSLFGARFMIPGTGLIPNNYMNNFDPHPGHALSIAPGKRVTTSMSPTIVHKDGKPWAALGLPGGLKIFPSAMQALVNLIAHGMDLQDAVEAPRLWTQGDVVEMEPAYSPELRAAMAARGHRVSDVKTVGGGMNAIRFHEDGSMEGAACWRADGTAVGVSGGLAAPGIRFVIEPRPTVKSA